MKLCVFLAIGESFADYKRLGQYELIVDTHLRAAADYFDRVWVFSYANESFTIDDTIVVLPNKWGVHRYLYSWLLPLFYAQQIRSSNLLRGLQLTGAIPALVSKLLFGKKCICNYGYLYWRFALIEKHRVRSWLYKMLERLVLPFADAVIVTASYLRAYVAEFVPTKKIYHLPNSVDTRRFAPQKRRKKYTVLFVGRLERQKNLENLIRAVAKLRNREVKLHIVGQGSQGERLKQLAQQLKGNCVFSGVVSHRQLSRIYNEALIFVLPSFSEGQPKALLEAMSCQIAVVASDIPAHREIVRHGENGMLTATDADSLAVAIKKLLSNSRFRRRVAVAARATILEYFDDDVVQKKQLRLMQRIAT